LKTSYKFEARQTALRKAFKRAFGY